MPHHYQDLEYHLFDEKSNIQTFHCSNQDLDEFLKKDALQYTQENWAITRLVYDRGQLIGYFTLAADSIEVDAIIADGVTYPHRRYPAIKLARLAVDDRWRRNGYGKNILLKSLIVALTLSKYVGIKYLTVDSEPESVDFYRKYGFINAKRRIYETIPLYKILHPPMNNGDDKAL